MSVSQQIHWMQLKHLLLRHMYNLSLPNLCATLLVDPTALLESVLANVSTLYCVVSYIVACVDVSRTVFWDRSCASNHCFLLVMIHTSYPYYIYICFTLTLQIERTFGKFLE